ncbi:hypothetical protein IF650_05535 [Cellulosimicrobium terreum]|nr:hypothetical protein [Cellulosimicrobium terreum]
MDHSLLFSAPDAPPAPSTPRRSAGRTSSVPDLGLNTHGEPRRRANPGDELTVDPTDRRRRARAALLDLRRDTIRRDTTR